MFYLKLNNLLCLSILSLLCYGFVKSACVLKYPANIEFSPIYTKYFGRYKLELPYKNTDITLQENEIIYAKCHTKFSSFTVKRKDPYYNSYGTIRIENQANITLHCLDNNLRYNNNILDNNVLECIKLDWNIYENNNTYEWCKTDIGLAALSLATKSNSNYHILAEVCFDLNNWSVQTIKYNVTASNQNVEMLRDVVKAEFPTVDLLGEKLWNLKITNDLNLKELDLQTQIKEMSKSNTWLHLANYELSPIVQGKIYENYLKEYSTILNTIWWSNLRLGNWKRFMDTLEKYAHKSSFQLYAGTSGVVRLPTDKVDDTTMDLIIKLGLKNKPVPAYIWTYLTSLNKTHKDFIIVGYNSPYADFYPRNEIVFCPDICNEIPWLKDISKSFKLNTAGFMFCCSPESIQHSNLLNSLFNTASITEESTLPSTDIYSTSVPYNEEEVTDTYYN